MEKKAQANIARKHHYIPQLYLNGFTESGQKNGLLYAHDLIQLKTWPSKPAKVGYEKDFYRVDVPGISPDEIEKVFWDVEGEAARVLKKIIQLNKLPGRPRDYAILMHFMAQLVMRRPSVRENQQQNHEKLLRMVAKVHAALPDDQLRALFDRMREENADMAEVDLDEFREFVKSDDYVIEFSQNHNIKDLLTGLLPTAADTIAPLLADRHWVLWQAQDGAGHFITTDRPVFLTWTIEVPPFFADSPGFALENTLVLFPISKTLLIYGKFDGPRGAIIPAERQQVALVNRLMTSSVQRFIYSTDENFVWQKEDGTIGDKRDMFEAIREYQAKKAATPAAFKHDRARRMTAKPVEAATAAQASERES